jgi:hemoglobin
MNARRDIITSADVRTLVDSFYERVMRDDLLAPIFNDVAHVDWARHLPTMYHFWESLLLGTGTYQGAPFPKHAVLPVQKEHFSRWLALFVETVDAHFNGTKADEAKGRAASIADTFAQRMGLLDDEYGLRIPLR